ncbi:hypothetical protein FOMG_19090 [Fusarium oxysporum f. sp. melonis 26406]|uniref:Zn(2)-C6 fungal-type domain-containing protein n=1 Tax=Fusarium oxysporum f. sp. melonis 26406 TaxID=1089452 RepID=W9YX87_FUSOX|nr:hypothetical protein FOMG_19090 [Fusarium oxysporum f. sp. melonis 26406]
MATEGTSAVIGSQNIWSCVNCRNRKVKCDRRNPCSNCTRAKTECVIPPSSRMSRKPRKRPDEDVLERVARLERTINALKSRKLGGIENGMPPFSRECDEAELFRRWRKVSDASRTGPDPLQGHRQHENGSSAGEESTDAPPEYRLGRLLLHGGGTRYINDCFWTNIDREVNDLKTILSEPPDSDDDSLATPMPQDLSLHHGFIFGFSSSDIDLTTLHPPHELASRIWAMFKANVDPLVKILHLPTMEPIMLEAKDHLDNLSRGIEALMFAIYYSVVTSLTSTDCVGELGETKSILLARYRFATEQALTRASFLHSAELKVLQAFVIFLAVLRRNDNAMTVWALTGLAVRISQATGLHRDGVHFGLVPFEVEMRRRLWWQVCLLDARASEDHGCDATIVEAHFDTQMPLNVNDADLSPNMTQFPGSRKGFTDMTFCLVGFELANTFRRIQHGPPCSRNSKPSFEALDGDHKERWINECHQRMEETYLANADLTVPPVWAAATLTRLVMSKMWLMAYHPFQRLDGQPKLSQRIKDKLFLVSVESIEYANQLDNDARTRKWSWLFGTYFQWHSVAFLLSELCSNTQGELVERAWRAMEVLVQTRFGDAQTDPRRAFLWRPLKRLMLKARMAREQAFLAEKRLLVPEDARSVTSYPAIDVLLGWASIGRAASEQYAVPMPNATTQVVFPSPSQATLNVGTYGVEQDVGMVLNMGFDWSITDIDTGPLITGRPPGQPHVLFADPQIQQLGVQNSTQVILEGTSYQHNLGNADEKPDSETWNDVPSVDGAQSTDPITDMWTWY